MRCPALSGAAAARACLLAATGLALVPASGCRRGPAVVFVEGVVRMDGQPLESASVAFTPVEAKGELPAAGFTDASGRFVLSARGAGLGRGTTAGDYIVIVKKEVVPPGQEEALSPIVELHTPVQYLQKETSPLRATVKQGRNRFEFELTSDKK